MIEILSITLRTLSYGKYGIFLIMGNAGIILSTVVDGFNFERGFVSGGAILILSRGAMSRTSNLEARVLLRNVGVQRLSDVYQCYTLQLCEYIYIYIYMYTYKEINKQTNK